MNILPPGVQDITQANLSLTIYEPQFSDPEYKNFRTKKFVEFKFWGEKKNITLDFDAESHGKTAKDVTVKYEVKTTRENFQKQLQDCAILKVQILHEVYKKKTKQKDKLGKANINLRGYLNKNVGSDNASNQVILIDREFDIIAKKKEGSSIVEGKVGKIRVQLKDNYAKNLLENQLKGLESSEDEKLSSFALNEIKTKMDLNAKFSSNIQKEQDDNRTVASSLCPETKRFESNDQTTVFDAPKSHVYFGKDNLDQSSLDRSKISLPGQNVVNLGNIKDKAKDQRLSGILAKIGKIKNEINTTSDDFDYDTFTQQNTLPESGPNLNSNKGQNQGSLERREDSPDYDRNIKIEQDGRQLKTTNYNNADQDSDDLKIKHKVSDQDKRYIMQHQKYNPCMLRQLSVETANVEFIKQDSLKKFLREKTYFHFVFNNPMNNEFLHQITLNAGEQLKTELISFKEIELDLNDLNNNALNATPLLTVSMQYKYTKDSIINVATSAFQVKDVLKRDDETYGISIPVYLNLDQIDKFKEKNFSLEKLKAEQNSFKRDNTLTAKANIEVINFSVKLLNIFHKTEQTEGNLFEDPKEPAQSYKHDLLNLYLHIGDAKGVSARDRFTPQRSLQVKVKDPIENSTITSNETQALPEQILNFHVAFPFSQSKNISDMRKTLILEVWDSENHSRNHFVGLVKLDLERGHKYLLNNDQTDIKTSLYPMILIDSQVGIFNFKENTDDGQLKVTLSIGTVDQNLKLQQGLNARFVDNQRMNQSNTMQQMVQQPQMNDQVNNQLESTQKIKDEKENTSLVASAKKQDPKDQTLTQEREPEFTKQVKQLKVLHQLYNQIGKLDVSIYELFKGYDQRDGIISKDHFVKAFSDRDFLNSQVTLEEVVLASDLFEYQDQVDLDEFIRCYKSMREGSDQAKRINFNFVKEVCKQIHARQEWEQIKQMYNSMSLLDAFWLKHDVQTIMDQFVDCGVYLQIERSEWKHVCVSFEDIFRLLLNRVTEQTFFLEFVVNEKNLRLQFNQFLIKIIKKLKEQGKSYKDFVLSLEKIESDGQAHIDNLVEKLHLLDLVVTSFELIVLKAYLGYDEITKKIWLIEIYKALEDMVAQINAKHPNYLAAPKKAEESQPQAQPQPEIQVDDDLIIGVLNEKKKPTSAPLSSTDKWENDLLQSINKRLQKVDIYNVMKLFNKYLGANADLERLDEQGLLYLFQIGRLNITASECHSLHHHLTSKQADLRLDFLVELIRDKKEPCSDNYSLDDLTCESIPVSHTNIVSITTNQVQPQFKTFNDTKGLFDKLSKPLQIKYHNIQTGNDVFQSDLFAFCDKYEKSFMNELLTNKDHSVNLLKSVLDIKSEHVISKNDINSIIDDDLVLELYLCHQDEFKDHVIAKAEILYKDFVQEETLVGSFDINRHVVFYDINTRQSLFKAHCNFRHTSLLNYKDKVDTTIKTLHINKLFCEINKFNVYLFNLNNSKNSFINEQVKIEIFKHYRTESIQLDSFDTTITQKPLLINTDYSPSQQFTIENIFNTHTILDKKQSFNCNKVELSLAQVELKFYHDDQYIGNVEVKLDNVINQFRGAYGTFALANKGLPSPFLVDLMIQPVDIRDHQVYNDKFGYVDFLRMQYALEFDNVSKRYLEHSSLKDRQQSMVNKEKTLSDKSQTLQNQNQDLARKISMLEKELGSYKNKEQELLRQKDAELERERARIRQELEKEKMAESQRMQKSLSEVKLKDAMKFTVSISGIHDLQSSEHPNSTIKYKVDNKEFTTPSKQGKLPQFGQKETHFVAPNQFRESSYMQFTLHDSNSDRHFTISVDLLLLKELNRSEGWQFINDLSGEAYGQIFIGLEIETPETTEGWQKTSDIELLKDSVFLNFDYSLMSNEENIYKKHKANLSELDRVTKKMQNFLLTDQFDDDEVVPDTDEKTSKENKSYINNNSLMDTHSSLGRDKENEAINIIQKLEVGNHSNQDIFNQSARLRQELSQAVQFADTLKINDLENTGQTNSSYLKMSDENEVPKQTKDMIQNVNFDIDNFINNARIIQDSINEAMTYTKDIDPNIKEEMFRSDLKLRNQNIDQKIDVNEADEKKQNQDQKDDYRFNKKSEIQRQQNQSPKKDSSMRSPNKNTVPHEQIDVNKIRSIGRDGSNENNYINKENDQNQIEPSSSDENTYLSRKKPKLKYSSILKSPAFKKELENLNKAKQSDIEKISNILKNQ